MGTVGDLKSMMCTINVNSPTVFRSPHVKIGSFNKQGGCGPDDKTAWGVHIHCDGKYVTGFPAGGRVWVNHNSGSADETMTGAWNCQTSFGLEVINSNSLVGAGACTETWT